MTPSAPSSMMAVPAHLFGTRAALFHLLRASGQRPVPAPVTAPVTVPAEIAVLRPATQTPTPDPVRAALQADVFVFAKSA